MRNSALWLVAATAVLASCGGSSDPVSSSPSTAPSTSMSVSATSTPSATPTCAPSPQPTPPPLSLEYPAPNSSGVAANIGQLIVAGPLVYGGAFALDDSHGVAVAIGTPTAAPSPLPTPLATPFPGYASAPLEAIPIPTLSPQSTYSLTYTYSAWANNPPTCTAPFTQHIASFTTQ